MAKEAQSQELDDAALPPGNEVADEVVDADEDGVVKIATSVAAFDKIAAGLAEIEAAHPTNVICEVRTTKGMASAVASRAAYRNPRIALEKARKAAKAPIIELGKSIDKKASEITERLLIGEQHYDSQIEAELKRKADEKEAKEKADALRIAGITARISEIVQIPVSFSGKSSIEIAAAKEGLEAIIVDDASFEELVPQANDAKAASIMRMGELLSAALVQEQMAAQQELMRQQMAEQAELLQRQAAQRAEAQRELTERQARIAREEEESRTRLAAEAQRLADEAAATSAAELRQRATFLQAQEDAFEEERQRALAILDADRKALASERKEINAQRKAAEPEQAESTQTDEPAHVVLVASAAHQAEVAAATPVDDQGAASDQASCQDEALAPVDEHAARLERAEMIVTMVETEFGLFRDDAIKLIVEAATVLGEVAA